MPQLPDLSLEDVLLRFAAYVIVGAIFGLIGTGLAKLLGDHTTNDTGREFINPVARFDFVGLITTIAFRPGWIRPIYPDPGKLKGGRAGLAAWLVATLVGSLVVLVILRLIRMPLAMTGTSVFAQDAIAVINTACEVGLWWVVLNILPIPPLLGANWLIAASPRLAVRVRGVYWPGAIILVLLMLFGVMHGLGAPIVAALSSIVMS